MLRSVLIVCLAIGCNRPAAAPRVDGAQLKSSAVAKAKESQDALIQGDFVRLVDLTHPKAVEKLGGKEKAVAFLTAETKKMKDEEGIEFKSYKFLNPGDPIRVGAEIYIGIPFALEMIAPGGRLLTDGMLIGVSIDEGTTWSFVDTDPGREKVKVVLPNLPDAIVFPKKELPVFLKD
jgi:hypothetical protein